MTAPSIILSRFTSNAGIFEGPFQKGGEEMNVCRTILAIGLCLSFLAGSAVAGINDFTLQRNVKQTDTGYTRTTTVSLSRTQNNEIFRHQSDLRYLIERTMDRARDFMAWARARMSDRMNNRDDVSAKFREVRERTEMMKTRQKLMLELQQQRLKDMQQYQKSLAQR